MPFALVGLFLGWDEISNAPPSQLVKLFFLVVLCMVFARSAAMAFNRYIDEKFDKLNPRTAIREIPSGIIARENALRFVLLNAVLFMVCTWFINTLCFFLSPVALFVIFFYSYTKRFTALCHLVLGVGLSLAPIGAYLAVTGHFALLPLLFSLIVITWVSGFDILYSLQDEEFDKSQQLHSIPVLLGRRNAMRVSNALHIITASLVLTLVFIKPFHTYYVIGAVLFISLLTYQHLLVKPNDISRVNLAFATTNGIASVLFGLFVILDLLIF